MTSELEQQFFSVFGIEPKKCNKKKCQEYSCIVCYNYCKYPEITDRILLELICVLSQSYPLNYEGWSFNTVQDLKETMLEDCIETAKRLTLSSVFANKIQQLFEVAE